MAKVALIKNAVLTWTYKPTAAVTRARFIGDNGNQIAVAGAKARAISQDSWTADDIARSASDLSGNYAGMTGTILGFEELEVDAAYATIGLELTSTNDGRGTQAVSTQTVNAILYSASSAAGDRVTVLKCDPYVKP